MEQRTFAPAGATMGEWKSPNLLGMSNEERDGALLDSLAQLHQCVESGHRKANSHRSRQAKVIKAVQGDVADVKDSLRTMRVSMGIEKPHAGEVVQQAVVHAQHPPGVLSWSPKKLAAWAAASVGGTIVAVQTALMAIQATDWKAVGDALEKLAHLVGR